MSDPFEHIDAYIQNQLSEADKKAFEEAMLHDNTLRSAVENYHLVMGIGMGLLEVEVRDILNKESNKIKPVSKPNYKWWIPVFIIFLAILSYFFLKYYETNQFEERIAYVMNDYVPPQVVFTRGGSDTLSATIDKGKDAFSRRDYTSCLAILKTMEMVDKNDEYYWLLGHTAFNLQNFHLAKEAFDNVNATFEKFEDVKNMQQRICKLDLYKCNY
ncbi:MAG: hypothetical protein KA270_01735 [Saprospiraceae bacterium]|nr:hypothetical protein [Saprospiraceae bacterium]MBP6565854.1 hypothetical protein [Saprospiraceae bacterium]